MENTLISATSLKKRLNDKNLIILDASSRTNKAGLGTQYSELVIPTAIPFDIKNNFSCLESDFPNTFPSENQFERECQKLGIQNSSQIVVYDNLGTYTSPRVWWMFKSMGHNQITVLNGGLPEWINNGFETKLKETKNIDTGTFTANMRSSHVKTYAQILETVEHQQELIIDARSKGRYDGTVDEPRKNLRSGHIPDSINIPFEEVLENGKFKSREKLESIFQSKIQQDKDLIFSCGSGITACIVLLACHLSMPNNKSLYDGSWTEWATRKKLNR